VVFGAEIIDERSAFASAALGFGYLAWGERFEVIIPPIKPAPEEGGKLARLENGQNDIEPLSCLDGFVEAFQKGGGFFFERARADIAIFQGSFRAAQFIDHYAASDEHRDFRRAEEKGLILFNLNLGRFELCLQDFIRPGLSLSSQNPGRFAIPMSTDGASRKQRMIVLADARLSWCSHEIIPAIGPSSIMKSNALCVLLLCVSSWARLGLGQAGSYVFSTIAGMAGMPGSADGTNANARFDFPAGIAVDRSGTLYESDITNSIIRKITPTGTNWVVTTIAGQAGVLGSADGTNGGAQFNHPNGVALDLAGNLYVADHYNHTIRKMAPMGTNWVVTTIAGLAGAHGTVDGTNADARFWSPTGVAVDRGGNVYVADTSNFTVRKVTPAGTNWVVTTIAGIALNQGFADGTNGEAQFDFPFGIAVDTAGRLYVADTGNNAIREIVPSGTNWGVMTIANPSTAMGSTDGPGSQATFNFPVSVCVDQAGNLFVTDQSNDTIRKIAPVGNEWVVTTVAGLALQAGTSNGLGSNVRFKQPWGIAVDGAGELYVTDYGNHTIRSGVYPFLRIAMGSQGVLLSWTIAAGSYTPETSASLDPGAIWSPLTNMPTTNGYNFNLTVQPGGAAAFYRLVEK
jgi:hypothetical protein